MKLKMQREKSKKVENEKKMAGKDETGGFLQFQKEQEARKEAAASLAAHRTLLTKTQ